MLAGVVFSPAFEVCSDSSSAFPSCLFSWSFWWTTWFIVELVDLNENKLLFLRLSLSHDFLILFQINFIKESFEALFSYGFSLPWAKFLSLGGMVATGVLSLPHCVWNFCPARARAMKNPVFFACHARVEPSCMISGWMHKRVPDFLAVLRIWPLQTEIAGDKNAGSLSLPVDYGNNLFACRGKQSLVFLFTLAQSGALSKISWQYTRYRKSYGSNVTHSHCS